MIKSTVHKFGKWYCQKINIKEYHSQQFRRINERPIEFSFVFDCLKKLNPISILDVGTGTTALPHTMRNCGYKVTAIDNISDYWPDGMFNRHFHVIDDDITDTKIDDNFDAVTCISVLEHIEKYDQAVANMLSLLNPGGHLILTCPYKETEYQQNVYKMKGASYGKNLPFVCQMYSRQELDRWLKDNNAEIIDQQFWQFWDGPYWTFGKQLPIPKQVSKDELHQHSCMLIRKK